MRSDKIASIFGVIMIWVLLIVTLFKTNINLYTISAVVIAMAAMLFVVITIHIASFRKEMKKEIEEVKEEIKNLHTLIRGGNHG